MTRRRMYRAEDLLQEALPTGGGTVPSGTGFTHVTAGVQDAAAQLVTNADVAGGAAIAESKLALSFATHTSANDPSAGEKAALAGTSGTPGAGNKYVTAAAVGTMAAQSASAVAITGGTITGLGTPSASSDAAPKSYVDSIAAGLKAKQSVRAATTAAGTLASSFENGDTVDGVVLVTGDRLLVKDQAAPAENGIYIVAAAGAPARATDADAGSELVSAFVFVELGTANADKAFVCTNDAITLGVTGITFTAFASVVGALIAANNLSDLASAAAARTNLGLVIGANVQAFDSDLSDLASSGSNGTGAFARVGSPALTTPTIASMANANHNHTNSAGGGQLTQAALSDATATAGASKIVVSDGSSKIDTWVSDGTTSVKGKVELATDGEAAANVVVQGNDNRLINLVSPCESIVRSTLCHAGTGFSLTQDVAYFVYLGRTTVAATWNRVRFNVRAVGSGSQTAEVGFFSTPAAPNRANQTVTKLVATGTVDSLLATGPCANTSAFGTSIAAGVHLWAGIRVVMGSGQPSIVGLLGDLSHGRVLSTATAGALTAAGPWTGVIITDALVTLAPDLHGALA